VSDPRKIVLWRHGQTTWNVERRFQGTTDIPLDETGVEQAARSARLLAALQPSAIVSSPLRRAAATAKALSEVTGLTVNHDPDLIERAGGAWEGLTNHEIRTRFPGEHAIWQPPGGETAAEVAKRFTAALERALERVPDSGLLVVVSHGPTSRTAASAGAWSNTTPAPSPNRCSATTAPRAMLDRPDDYRSGR
jgi:broad specificity phosphatase PhoE